MRLEQCYIVSPDVLLQEIDDEILLFNSATGLFFTINQIGKTIWKLFNDYSCLNEILIELVNIFDASLEQLEIDLLNFTKELLDQKLIYEK
ncbi:MAG: PqqD family peptide modification chaperone [Campylobacterales bacterium]|nr:PqqD family peptide modification chaperone [Campylobacterales bacterium]